MMIVMNNKIGINAVGSKLKQIDTANSKKDILKYVKLIMARY